MKRMVRISALILFVGSIASCAGSGPSADPSGDEEKDYAAAERAFRAGRFDRAISYATAVIAKRGELPKPYFLRAKAYHAKEDTVNAEADFTKAIDNAPESRRSIYHFWRGLFYSDEQRRQLALSDFDAACKLQIRFPVPEYYMECFRERAKSYLALGRFDAALKDCNFVLTRHPDERTRREFEALKSEVLRKRRSGK